MRINNKLKEKFGIQLSSKEKSMLKNIILILFIVLVLIIIAFSIVGSYIAFDKFVKPSLLKQAE
jgi:uncharacterized membrane protein YjgN (DUF898 family)